VPLDGCFDFESPAQATAVDCGRPTHTVWTYNHLLLQEQQQSSQVHAPSPTLVAATVEKYHSIIHTPSMPFANYQLNQERHLRLLQSQLDGHKLRADEFETLSERLTAEIENVKERHSAAGHRQFQVLRPCTLHVYHQCSTLRFRRPCSKQSWYNRSQRRKATKEQCALSVLDASGVDA